MEPLEHDLDFKREEDLDAETSQLIEDDPDDRFSSQTGDARFSSDVTETRYRSEDTLHYLDHRQQYKSLPIATKYEITRILAERIFQLNNGAAPLITWTGAKSGLNITELIAREELRQRRIPLIVRRTFPNGSTEDWKLQDFRRIDI